MDDNFIKQNLSSNAFLPNDTNSNNQLNFTTEENKLNNDLSNFKISEFTVLKQFKNIFHKIKLILFYLYDKKLSYRNILYLIFFSFLFIYIIIDEIRSNKRKLMGVYDNNKYKIEIKKYNILYDINKASSMKVTENITINYQGILNTGFLRFIPVSNGVQIRNVQIGQITAKGIEKVYHKVYLSYNSLIFDIGDNQRKYGKTESYSITYELRILNRIIQKKNMLPLNVIGHEWNCKINNANVRLIVPSEFKEAQCYVGPYGTTKEYNKFNVITKNKKKIISSKFDFLKEYEGVTFNLHFSTIRSYTDFSCVNYILAIIVTFLFMTLFIIHAYYKNKIVPVRYTSALNTIDPLIMSKVLNGDVKKTDVPSIIFYWASKGFLSINFDDPDDPVLIKNVNSGIPESFPSYQKYMFDKLFKNGDIVRTSELKYKFYKTINKVIDIVDSQTNIFVNNNTVILSLFLAIFGSMWTFIAPLKMQESIANDFEYSITEFFLISIIWIGIWFIRFFMSYKYIINNEYVIEWIFVGALSLFSCFFYVTNVPSLIISYENKCILCILSILCIICSTSIITKTAYFKVKINEVFGFKEFIEHPVNEEFDVFLKKDPELFYNFICYAQVLGLTDKWKHKFDNLASVDPPHWIMYSDFENYRYNNYNWMYRRIHMMNNTMHDNLVQSPPQKSSNRYGSSHSSSFHGGGGGGGGGFGGGGGCGR